MTAAIVTLIALISIIGTVALVLLSARVREEIRLLTRTFDRADRAIVPLVATVRTDRDRLAARLDRWPEPGPGPGSIGR